MTDNNLKFQNQKKRPQQSRSVDSIIESLRSLGQNTQKSFRSDLLKPLSSDILSSFTGKIPKRGELRANQEVLFNKERSPYPFISRPEIIREKPNLVERGLEQKIEMVRREIKSLIASVNLFNKEIEKTVEEAPVEAGVYYINFYERLRSLVMLLREQVEDSRTWLSLWQSKKKKYLNFWGMFKKKGTQWGLSSERRIATQAG